MALSHVSKLYAVTDAKIKKITADPAGGTTTFAAAQDIPGIKSVSIDGDINSVELRGDNTLLDTNALLSSLTLTFNFAKLNLDALIAMLGGTVTDAGTTPNQIATMRLANTDSFSYFQFEAKTPTAGADTVTGDAHIVVYKCMLSGFPQLGMAEEDYQTFSVQAKAVARLSDNRWLDIVLNETATAIV